MVWFCHTNVTILKCRNYLSRLCVCRKDWWMADRQLWIVDMQLWLHVPEPSVLHIVWDVSISYKQMPLSIYLSICLSVCLSVRPSVRPPARPSIHLTAEVTSNTQRRGAVWSRLPLLVHQPYRICDQSSQKHDYIILTPLNPTFIQ